MLEEPQAAFYAWTAHARNAWRDQIAPGDLVLVCDVGGGTADFSLIAVTDIDGRVELERVSVGEHILLGGDNMDLALAFALQAKLEAERARRGKSMPAIPVEEPPPTRMAKLRQARIASGVPITGIQS